MSHVLAVRLDNEGDVLLAGPAIRALAAGAGRVTLLCGPRGRQAAALLPGVDDVLCWRAPWIDPEPDPLDRADVEALVARIAALRADRAVIFGSFHQSPLPTALLLRLAGVPWIGATSDHYPGALLDLRHRISHDVHEVERSLDLVRSAGFDLPAGDDGALRVRCAEMEVPAGPYVVIHPGASMPARAWVPERSAVLVDALVVGNTGPAHLAAAVGTPVVSLFAPTVAAVRWRPWQVPHALLYVDVPCAGCRARVCPVPGHPCLAGVEVADVLAAVEHLVPAEAFA